MRRTLFYFTSLYLPCLATPLRIAASATDFATDLCVSRSYAYGRI